MSNHRNLLDDNAMPPHVSVPPTDVSTPRHSRLTFPRRSSRTFLRHSSRMFPRRRIKLTQHNQGGVNLTASNNLRAGYLQAGEGNYLIINLFLPCRINNQLFFNSEV
jgi:hypothetical protein